MDYLSLDSDQKEKYLSSITYTDLLEIAETLCGNVTILFNNHNRKLCFEFCDLVKDNNLIIKVLTYCIEYETKPNSFYPDKYIKFFNNCFFDDKCNLSTRLELITCLSKCFLESKDTNKLEKYFLYIFDTYISSSYNTYKNIYKFYQKQIDLFESKDTSLYFVKKCTDSLDKIELGILCSQMLLNLNLYKKEIFSMFKNCIDKVTDYNKKADIYDLLYNYGDEEEQKIYKMKIKELGESENFVDNKQNVHDVDVTNLQQMLTELDKYYDEKYKFEDVEKDIISLCETYGDIKDLETKEKIQDVLHRVRHSLCRIYLDRVKYGGRYLASQIFLNIYSYIQKSEYKYELQKRCIEELIDMAFTCTTGHILKLINILTGFSETIGITISFKDEINTLISKKVRDLVLESKESEDILLEWSSNSLKKPKYNEFYRNNIVDIVKDIKKIYVPTYIKEEEFDQYTREAIMKMN